MSLVPRIICLWMIAMPLLTACNLSDFRAYERVQPLTEKSGDIDKAAFVAYLDTAAIDDWEGIWLLMSAKGNCYVMLERVNDVLHGSFYTHRIKLWSGSYGVNSMDMGAVIGYLEQGVDDDTKRITLYDGYIQPHRNYSSYVYLDDDNRYIVFGAVQLAEDRNSEYYRMGMMRIYPRRSTDEGDYKVRYL